VPTPVHDFIPPVQCPGTVTSSNQGLLSQADVTPLSPSPVWVGQSCNIIGDVVVHIPVRQFPHILAEGGLLLLGGVPVGVGVFTLPQLECGGGLTKVVFLPLHTADCGFVNHPSAQTPSL
jgi:hypothetical protein